MQRQIPFNPNFQADLEAANARLAAAHAAIDEYLETREPSSRYSVCVSAIEWSLIRAQDVGCYKFAPADLELLVARNPELAARLPANGSPFSYDFRPVQYEVTDLVAKLGDEGTDVWNHICRILYLDVYAAEFEIARLNVAKQKFTIHNLPNEMLVAILEHVPDRAYVRQTCSLLREVADTM